MTILADHNPDKIRCFLEVLIPKGATLTNFNLYLTSVTAKDYKVTEDLFTNPLTITLMNIVVTDSYPLVTFRS